MGSFQCNGVSTSNNEEKTISRSQALLLVAFPNKLKLFQAPTKSTMELNSENCTFDNQTAEEWAKQSQELQNELQLYRNMARVAGLFVLNMFFMFLIFSLPVKKRKRLFFGPAGLGSQDEVPKTEDTVIEMPRTSNNATTSNNAITSNNGHNNSSFIQSNPILSNGA